MVPAVNSSCQFSKMKIQSARSETELLKSETRFHQISQFWRTGILTLIIQHKPPPCLWTSLLNNLSLEWGHVWKTKQFMWLRVIWLGDRMVQHFLKVIPILLSNEFLNSSKNERWKYQLNVKKVDCQSLLQEAYLFTGTKENLSLLWKLAAISYDKINENIQVPIPKHAWQKHVLSFPVMLHLSTLTTICLHGFHLLCSSRTEPACSTKVQNLFQKTFIYFYSVSSVLVWMIFLPKIFHETKLHKLLFKSQQISEMGLNINHHWVLQASFKNGKD